MEEKKSVFLSEDVFLLYDSLSKANQCTSKKTVFFSQGNHNWDLKYIREREASGKMDSQYTFSLLHSITNKKDRCQSNGLIGVTVVFLRALLRSLTLCVPASLCFSGIPYIFFSQTSKIFRVVFHKNNVWNWLLLLITVPHFGSSGIVPLVCGAQGLPRLCSLFGLIARYWRKGSVTEQLPGLQCNLTHAQKAWSYEDSPQTNCWQSLRACSKAHWNQLE